jgi:hypothetical protein
MQRINFTQDTLNTLKRSARCSFANAVYKLTMKAQQGLKCDDLFKKSVLMNEVNKLLCKYKLDSCISFHPALEAGISSWYFGIGSFTGVITYNLIIDGVETFIGSGSSVENIVIDINNNTEGTGVTAVLGEGGYFTIYSPAGCFIKADLTGSKDPAGSIPATQVTFLASRCPQVETCVDYTEEELNCIAPQDLQLLFEFTHRYKETLVKSTRRVTSPSTSSSSASASDCCNWGSIGGSIGNQSDLVAYLNTIKKNFIAASNESILLSNDIKSLNFLGAGVTATNSGGDISITIPGGGGGGSAYWGDIAGIITEQTDLITYLGDNYYPLVGNPAGYLTDISATNGLTEDSGNTVKLGGNLIENTSIDNNGFNLDIYSNTSTPSGILLDLNLNDVGTALQSIASNGFGLRTKSFSGINLESLSYDDCATSFIRNDVSTDSTVPVSKIYRGTTGVAQDGIGGAFDMWVSTSGTGISTPATAAIRQVAKWDIANLTTRKSSYELWGVHNGVQQRYSSLGTNRGQLILDRYGAGDFANTPVWLLGVDASGNVVETTVSGGLQTLADTLALGNTSGAKDIQFDATQGLLFDNAARLREGTRDAGLGGNKGVAQVCSLEYELKWEAGRLFVMDQTGMFIRQSLYNFNIAPTVTDDVTKGYMTGSLWTLDDGTVYECTDAGTLGGDAVWVNRGIGAGMVYTTVGALQTLENNGELSLTTLYIITDAAPYKLMCKAEAVDKLSNTATIVDAVYSGQVYYDLEFDTVSNGTIYDVNRNNYNGVLPSDLTIGFSCSYNTFYQKADSNTIGANCEKNTFEQGAGSNTLGENCVANTFKQGASSNTVLDDSYNNTFEQGANNNYLRKYCYNNTFKQGANGFIFFDALQNVTIDAGMTGSDYSLLPDYNFLYNNTYAATIFTDGTDNYHRYFDIANDRIVVTDLSTLAVSYIGGGVASVAAGTNITVTGTATNPIINSLADRYSTSSVTSNTISNGAKTFTVDANLAYIPLQEVLIVNDPTHHMHATVTSYSGTTLVVNVTSHTGTGTFTSWVLNLDGVPVDAITGVGTVNEISYFTSGQVIASLAVATYPSLTELSYVKGVTSAIQTQINGKQATLTNPVTGTGTNNEIAAFNSTGSTITSLPVATYPSLTELSYVKGVSSAIQTQINGKQATLVSGTNIKTVEGSTLLGSTPIVVAREIQLACSDETTALTAGTAKVTFRAPRAMVITGVRASLTTAQTSGSIFTVDINDSGTSILSTKLTIDNTEKTSTTAATLPVISDTAIADDAEITIDIDQIGDGTAKGLKVTILYTI